MTYRISHWLDYYEKNHKESEVVFRWVAVPTKHDGKGFRRLAAHPRAVEVFCAWNLILQVGAKMPKRGVLADENGPLDAQDLADSTGFPATIFEIAFSVLTDERIGWLESVPAKLSPDLFGQVPPTGQNRTEQDRTKKGATHPLPAAAGAGGNGSHGKRVGPQENGVTDDAIYRAYPRHVEPKAARKAIRNAVNALRERGQPDPRAWLLHRTQLYAEARRRLAEHDPESVQFIPYPQKWFNRARYDDAEGEWSRPSSRAAGNGARHRGAADAELVDKALS